jgi:chromosome segregation ATPase
MRLLPILLLLALAVPALAEEMASPAAAAEAGQIGTGEHDAWRERLFEARQRLENARVRFAEAQQAYQDARQRRYPRGDAKAELLAELERAEQELDRAETELPSLLEEAHRAGVPPGVLREFEN